MEPIDAIVIENEGERSFLVTTFENNQLDFIVFDDEQDEIIRVSLQRAGLEQLRDWIIQQLG
jgi:hypothetical protein